MLMHTRAVTLFSRYNGPVHTPATDAPTVREVMRRVGAQRMKRLDFGVAVERASQFQQRVGVGRGVGRYQDLAVAINHLQLGQQDRAMHDALQPLDGSAGGKGFEGLIPVFADNQHVCPSGSRHVNCANAMERNCSTQDNVRMPELPP